MGKNWRVQVFLMELRKLFAYRADFWVNFVGQTILSVGLAYYLWSSIFAYAKTDTIKGLNLEYMIFYYLMVPLIFRIQQGQGIGFLSRDIYEGSLNKYLLYPIEIFKYKVSSYFANSSFFFFQLLIIICLYKILFHDADIYHFSLICLIQFTLSIFIGTFTFFYFFAISELMAFWFDNTWSLGVILRFLTNFLGGVLIPLSLYPEWAQQLLQWTPFPYLLSFPLDALMGNLTFVIFAKNILISIFWLFFFKTICMFIWKKGQYSYSGVGI